MKRTKEDAEETRRALLDAAAQVFSRSGYAAARLEDIAAEAGVTRGAIAHHFGGKSEVFDALVTAKQAVIEETVRAATALGGTPAERLRRFMVALLERLEDDRCYRQMTELTLFQRGDNAPSAILPRSDVYLDGIRELLTGGVRSGDIRSDMPLGAAAKSVLGLINGVSLLWLMAPRSFSLKAEAGAIVDVFLEGLVLPKRRRAPRKPRNH